MSADPHITEVDKMQYVDVSASSYLDIRLMNDLTKKPEFASITGQTSAD
jgi:hypothetical protein